MKKNVFLSVLLFVVLFGCSKNGTSTDEIVALKELENLEESKKWALMTGKWYGNQPTKSGGRREHITDRYADGTYKITYRIYENTGALKEGAEVGYWGVSGPIYFSIFKGWLKDGKVTPALSSNPYNYDAYQIIILNDKEFKYKHLSSGNVYTLIRVDSEYQLGSK